MRVAMLGSSYQSALLPYARAPLGVDFPSPNPTDYANFGPGGTPDSWSSGDWAKFGTDLLKLGADTAVQILKAKSAQTQGSAAQANIDALLAQQQARAGLDQNTVMLMIGGGLLLLIVGGVVLTRKRRR